MRFRNSSFSLLVSLAIVLMFVVTINLATGTKVTAVDNGAANALKQEEGQFDPLQEEDEDQEGFEDEQDWDGEDDDFDENENEGDFENENELDDDDFDQEEDEQGWDEDEPEWDENEGFDEEVEMERMEIESNIGRLETISRLAEIAQDETKMASYAIMQLGEFVENEEEAIELLKEMLESNSVSKSTKNLLKMKLAELYSWQDRREDALEVFKSMLNSK